MALTGKQKKYIKKNIAKKSLTEIVEYLGVSPKEIKEHLQKRWGKKKYQRFLTASQRKHLQGVPCPAYAGQFLHLEGEYFRKPLPSHLYYLKGSLNWKTFAFLAFLVFAVYLNSLNNGFVADDVPAILENESLGSFSNIYSQPLNFLRPLFYFIIYKTTGLNPIFYRLINITFHLGTVFTLYGLITLIATPLLAILTASIFAIHPILTESITWISGGGHAQYSFFFLLSFLLYILSRSRSFVPPSAGLRMTQARFARNLKLLLASLVCFVLALISSEKAVVLPAILTLFVFTFDNLKKPAESAGKHWKRLIPFWIIGVTFGLIYISGLGQRITELQTQFYQEPTTHNPLIQIPIAITSYLKLIFWPKDLTLYHSEMSFTTTQYLLQLGIFLVFLGIIAYCYKKSHHALRGSTPMSSGVEPQQVIFFWLSFFLISLLPTLTPFGVSWIVAERYVYLGSIGIFVVTALLIKKVGELFRNEKVSYVILTIIVVLLGTRTVLRNRDWQNQDTLWLSAAKTSPSSPQNHNNLGDLYGRRGDFEKAIAEFKRAIELKPGYADAYHNLGNTYQQMGKIDEAIENFEKAISFNPNLWQSYQNLAAIYFEQENLEKAEEYLQKAIEINPLLPHSVLP